MFDGLLTGGSIEMLRTVAVDNERSRFGWGLVGVDCRWSSGFSADEPDGDGWVGIWDCCTG